jgi:hypothetical protein
MAFPTRVDRPIFEPHRCLVLGKGDDPVGWIDCGNLPSHKPDPRSYVSHGGALTAARLFGYDIPQLVQDSERKTQLEAELAQVQAKLAELEAEFAAIDMLASAGFVARKKPGRKVPYGSSIKS